MGSHDMSDYLRRLQVFIRHYRIARRYTSVAQSVGIAWAALLR